MSTFWLKIAAVVVLVAGIVVLVNVFSPSERESKPEAEPKGFYDVIEEDDKRLRAEPQAEPVEAIASQSQPELQPAPVKPVLQFKELSLDERVGAERLFEMALAQRKMARLPGFSYKLMVDYCRQIIEKYPDSVYAFKAKRMLGEVPQRYHEQYNLTDEEMGD